LVIDTLTPLDPSRNAYRLIGGVLVERTVSEVLPAVVQQNQNFLLMIAQNKERLEKLDTETNAYKVSKRVLSFSSDCVLDADSLINRSCAQHTYTFSNNTEFARSRSKRPCRRVQAHLVESLHKRSARKTAKALFL
jgi:hypothetical protein